MTKVQSIQSYRICYLLGLYVVQSLCKSRRGTAVERARMQLKLGMPLRVAPAVRVEGNTPLALRGRFRL